MSLIGNMEEWNALYQGYRAEIDPATYSAYNTEQNQENHAKIHATLQYLANHDQLAVYRRSGNGQWFHSIDILDQQGECAAETGGFITGTDVHLGKWDKEYVEKTEFIDEEHITIHAMIGYNLPDLAEFKDENGQSLSLGVNDDYFWGFDIVIHNRMVEDEFIPTHP